MKTRQLHFIKWCIKVKITEPTLALLGSTQRNFIMACYATSLTSNETIFCKTIKSSTISIYLTDAAKLSILNKLPDPTKNGFNQTSHYIQNILREHRRWESIPNRREPLTYPMVQQAALEAKKDLSPCQHTLNHALYDWLVLGMVTGFRRSEWCQDRTYSARTGDITRNIDGSSSAFILSDFTFEHTGGVRMNNHTSSHILSAQVLKIKWRFQKNGDNGQILSYTLNSINPNFCPVRAALRIRARAIIARVPPDYPISIFIQQNGLSGFIDNIHVSDALKDLASKVYNITNSADLARFTSHSIRVGACVVLHEANKSPDFIKFRIRWKSDSYLMYLRNTPKLANQHNSAIDLSLSLPH